jgi:DNA-nicking Smr family endonuclease
MSRRRLSEEERTLWKGVTRSIAPLRKMLAREADETAPAAAPPAAKPRTRAKASAVAPAAPVPAEPAAPPLAPLGRRTKQRIARGRDALDGRLDLHGLTQAEAHDALFGFLRTRRARGARMVLIITGKGAGDGAGGRGVLKRMVPLWLRLPEFRELVVGFESAAIRHGGEGALYVHLRRTRGSG